MRRPRDSQRGRVYRAEQRALRDQRIEEIVRFDSVAACQGFVDGIYRRAWFGRRFASRPTDPGRRPPRVVAGSRNGRAHYSPAYHEIRTSPGSRVDWVLLHEITHALVGVGPEPWHGRRFARTFLVVVRYALGEKAARRLREAYRAEGVRWHPKRGPRQTGIEASEAAGGV